MAWIESHQSLSRHRKTLRAAALLKCDRHKLIGHLHELWWWGLDNVTSDGALGETLDGEIAGGAEWDGDAAAFVAALTEAGFIDATPEGRFVHDWYEFAGRHTERRIREAARGAARAVRKRRELRRRVIARDGLVCGICGGGVEPGDVHLDHIVPFSHGGPTTAENLRVTHRLCNLKRGNRA
jgi:hypothetical protein